MPSITALPATLSRSSFVRPRSLSASVHHMVVFFRTSSSVDRQQGNVYRSVIVLRFKMSHKPCASFTTAIVGETRRRYRMFALSTFAGANVTTSRAVLRSHV